MGEPISPSPVQSTLERARRFGHLFFVFVLLAISTSHLAATGSEVAGDPAGSASVDDRKSERWILAKSSTKDPDRGGGREANKPTGKTTETTETTTTTTTTTTIETTTTTTAPAPTADGSPTTAVSEAPLGLHVTAAELAIWRARSADGPYRVAGDVSENSPGDWQRIELEAAEFLAAPTAGRWSGPVANNPGGCVQLTSSGGDTSYVPPVPQPESLRNAAFVALVSDSSQHAAAVKHELLAQARTPAVNFNDRERYCIGNISGDNHPMFDISNWLAKLLFAYDYLQIYDAGLFSAAERAELDAWFNGAAGWMQPALDNKLAALFVDRAEGDYTLTPLAQNDWRKLLYQGGPEARTLHRRYNNRAATTARYVTLVGVEYGNPSLVHSGKLFVKEVLAYSYFPQGAPGEFERWQDTDPAKGWKYAAELTGSMITIADTLARHGDAELYHYTTTAGALGTEGEHHLGGPKSLKTLVTDLFGYVDGTYKRYTPPGDLIDPVAGRWIHDTMLAMSNVFYRDGYIRGAYTRETAPAYPSQPRFSQGDPRGGEWGIYPGALFMFGGTEGAVWPYPAA